MTEAYPLVVIAGPTASGKSTLAIRLAGELGGEVLCCDSAQIYRGFDIGTGKVTSSESRGIPHHMLDLCDPAQSYTAGDYMRDGRRVLAQLRDRGRLPIVTAGTGLYLRALLEGLAPLPRRSDRLRARLDAISAERGSRHLHALLARVDPPSAASIAPQDGSKLVRALEICLLARKPRSRFFAEGRRPLDGFRIRKFVLGPDRDELYGRIEARVDAMMEAGWLEEVHRLRRSYGRRVKPFGFLGYKQLSRHLDGEISREQAVAETKYETRQYARRQFTWFRRESDAEWIDGFGFDLKVQSCVADFARRFRNDAGS